MLILTSYCNQHICCNPINRNQELSEWTNLHHETIFFPQILTFITSTNGHATEFGSNLHHEWMKRPKNITVKLETMSQSTSNYSGIIEKAYTLGLSQPQGTTKTCMWIHTNATAVCMMVHAILWLSDLIPSRFSDLFNFNDAFLDHLLGLQLLGFTELAKLFPVIPMLSGWTSKK